MSSSILPTWLTLIDLRFAEGEDDGGDSGDNKGDTGGDDKKDDEVDQPGKDDNAGLLKALQEERALRKKAEKDNAKRTQAEKDKELLEQGEIVKLKADVEARDERLKKLGERYFKDKVDAAIREEARKFNFIDVSDALAGVDRSIIAAEQDDDDPATVAWEPANLTKAVKQLAESKKHLIKQGTDDGEPTGSSYGGGKGNKGKEKNSEDNLKALYPNL